MRNFSLLTVVAVAILSRFLPHPPNMTSVGALAIFSGFAIRPRLFAIALPLLILFVTDFALGFHNTMLFTYGAWSLIALLSMFTLAKYSWTRLAFMSLAASSIFFVTTNLGVWLVGGLYPQNIFGLSECFVAALPFFGNQLSGDILFTGALFALWTQLEKQVPALQKPV
jgi:hypothetical protein